MYRLLKNILANDLFFNLFHLLGKITLIDWVKQCYVLIRHDWVVYKFTS